MIWAGTGSFSSFASRGGFAIGLLKSVDGGDTWEVVAPVTLAGVPITSVVAVANGPTDTIIVGGRQDGIVSSAPLPFNAMGPDIQTQLRNAYGTAVAVAAGGSPHTFTVTWSGVLGNRDMPLLQVVSSLTGGASPGVTIATTTNGSPTQNEVQTITIAGGPTGGSFVLVSTPFGTRAGGIYRCDQRHRLHPRPRRRGHRRGQRPRRARPAVRGRRPPRRVREREPRRHLDCAQTPPI